MKAEIVSYVRIIKRQRERISAREDENKFSLTPQFSNKREEKASRKSITG